MKFLLFLIMMYGVDGHKNDMTPVTIVDGNMSGQNRSYTNPNIVDDNGKTNSKTEKPTRSKSSESTTKECRQQIQKLHELNTLWIPKPISMMTNVNGTETDFSQNEGPFKLPNRTLFFRKEKEVIDSITRLTSGSSTYILKDVAMAMTVFEMNERTNGHVQITAPSVSNETRTANISIPVEPFQNASEDQQKVSVVTYDSDEHFTLNNSIMSKVIRIEVCGRETVNSLTNPLIIQFPVNNYTNHTNTSYIYSCQYYDVAEITWKTDGCNTTQLSGDVVECSCDHMTPFAVLLVEVNNMDKLQWEIMSYISYVGCSLSAIFSAFCVLMFIFNRNVRKEVSSSIHVSLSGALLLLNFSFMLSEWAATLEMTGVCVFIAVMIHYSLLSCFTWMAIEALHLYLLLIRVFNIYIKYYLFKLSVIGWGVPAVVIGSLLSIHNTHKLYGSRKLTLSNSNATNSVCWIRDPLTVYGVNLSYFSVIFLFNLAVLLTASRQIFKLKHVEKKKHKVIPVKDAGTVLGLMCLLGTSWGLVFLSAGYTNYVVLYLFCILNTMQGSSIFLWMCLTVRPDKNKLDNTKSLSTVDTFNSEK